ncbi:MAG: hypothetical protein CMF45_05585 [Legionellales bacterium]|nr:hypothetical protein [Legionellales bacterium]|tara:strand:+ start:3243 stop:3818 length:576 start_codon:yes stop_codon:yes gene_type:complete
MNIILFVFLNFLFISSLSAEIVYKSVDANGNVSFSDYRIEEAEEIRIKTPQIINAPKAWISKPILSKDKPNKFNYTNLTIDNPKDDTTIHSGKVNITVTLKPALIENDVIVLFMDGKEVLSGKSLNFSLENVDRGTHKIYVTVKNEVSKVLKRSAEIIFHVRRVVQLSPKLSSDSKLITPLNPPRPTILNP